MRQNWVELVFRQRMVAPAELDRDVVEPAGREAPIEVPQARNDHPDDRDVDIRTRLIEHAKIKAASPGEIHASCRLLVGIETAKVRTGLRPDGRTTARRQIGMVIEA